MLFNTFHFAYFFASAPDLLGPPHRRLAEPPAAPAGYYFYACWDPQFLPLLILSTAMDFACGLAVDPIEAPRKRKLFVTLSMALNLGMLGYFKYFNFFADRCSSRSPRRG